MNGVLVDHAEAHTVALMRENRQKNATLCINKEPCDWVNPANARMEGCENALPDMLSPDETRTVYAPNGYAKVFQDRP